MAEFPDHPLWDFSLAVYAAPGVAPACLALQDRHGIDVNALMACVWLGAAGRGPVPGERLARWIEAVGDWHEAVVRPLRAVRRRLKTPIGAEDRALAETLRARLQKIEIDAEHIEQLMLARAADGAAPPAPAPAPEAERLGHAALHLALYLGQRNIAPDAADRQALATLLGAAFPRASATAIAAALDAAFRAPAARR